MKRCTDYDALLADVVTEAEPCGFRAGLLEATLRCVRRKRRMRHAAQGTVTAILLGTAALLGWRFATPPVERCPVVRTQPLAPSAIVSTRSLDVAQRVESRPFLATVHTAPEHGRVHWIGDAELLALASPRPVVLMRNGPHAQRLIFVGEWERARR